MIAISELRKKLIISKQAAIVLSDRFSDVQLRVIKSLVKDRKKKGGGSKSKYEDDIKDFSVSLHYYSPRAYRFVSKLFSLPHESTIRWISSIDAYPGM